MKENRQNRKRRRFSAREKRRKSEKIKIFPPKGEGLGGGKNLRKSY